MQSLQVLGLKKFSKWLVSNIWILLKRILKNPLGFVWWAFKMYIALMLLMLCLVISFGSFAQIVGDDPTIDYDAGFYSPTIADRTICFGWHPTLATSDPSYPTFSLDGIKKASDCSREATSRYRSDYMAWVNKSEVCPSVVTSVFATGWYIQRRYLFTNLSTKASFCADYGTPYAASVGSSIKNFIKEDTCPPAPSGNAAQDAISINYRIKSTAKVGTSTTVQCFKPKPKPSNCPKASDIQIAPIKHFDTTATTDKICVKSDGGELCPFKKESLGVFVPDTSNPTECENGDIPESKETPPIDCKDMASGQRACRADPNQKCKVGQGGIQDCDSSCGYVNNVFMCIEGEPTNTPLDPLKNPDDNITNPDTKTPDLDKQDYKDVMKGAEERLDNVVTSLQNLGKQMADQKADGPTKSGQDRSNMYLSSIDKNVAEINKKMDGSNSDEDDVPLNPPEIDTEHNDFETRNFGTVIDTAAQGLLSKPIFQSIKTFFTASFGGSCPTWSVSIDVYDVTIDQLCSETMMQVWPGIRAIIILIFSFLAFRVAFLD